MKFFLIIINFFILFLPIKANSSLKEWKDNLYIKSQESPEIQAIIRNSSEEEKTVYIHFKGIEVCNRFSTNTSPSETMIINGSKVQMIEQCVGKNILAIFPSSIEGKKYLINEFKTKKNVEFRVLNSNLTFNFSAIGFDKIFENFEMNEGAL